MRGGQEEYIPSLDGLRALSIALVVLGHAFFTGPPQALPLTVVFDGTVGVRIFFVISGFLITTLLVREQGRGQVSLGRFYMRRTLRLAPVQLCFIGALFILTQTSALQVSACQFATALTYTKNYACGTWVDGHLWSLAVEEQFYLLWPTLLLLLPGRRWTLAAMAALIVAAPISRAVEYQMGARTFLWLTSNADVLMIGCAAALAYADGRWNGLLRFRPGLMRAVAVLAVATPMVLGANLLLGWFTVMFGPLLQALAVAYLICSLIGERRGLSYRLLNLAPLRFLGRMSYSLYVWQQLFFASAASFGLASSVLLTFPFNIGFALLAGFASYMLIERPMNGLRARFRQPATGGGALATSGEA